MSSELEQKLTQLKHLHELGLLDEATYREQQRALVSAAMGTPRPEASQEAAPLLGPTAVEPASSPLSGPTRIDSTDELPAQLGNYRILDRIGSGGMGTVVRARHVEEGWAEQQGGVVALKLIHPHISSSPEFRQRFFEEARLGRQVQHPGLATVYDVVTDGPWLGAILDHVEGPELSQWIRPGGLPLAQLLPLVRPLAETIDHLHSLDIVHRDIKPSNVRVRPDGRPILLDLGIARDLSRPGSPLTQTHTTLGTRAWMAPEQVDARRVTPAADVYAFGLLCYALLSGRMPWAEEATEGRVLANKLNGDLRPLSEGTQLPEAVCEAIMAALSREPEDRTPSCGELVARLADPEPVRAPAPTLEELPALVASLETGERARVRAAVLSLAELAAGPARHASRLFAGDPELEHLQHVISVTLLAKLHARPCRDHPDQDALRDAQVIPLLVPLLESTDAATQQGAVAAVGGLAFCNPVNQDALARAGAGPLLLPLLSSPRASLRLAAAQALCALVDRKSSLQAELHKAGIAAILLRGLRTADVAEQAAAALTLSCVASHSKELRAAVAEADAIPLLVKRLDSDHGPLRLAAAEALATLAEEEAHRTAIRVAGGLPKLLKLLRASRADEQLGGAKALSYLARRDSENRSQLQRTPFFSVLRERLASPKDAHQLVGLLAVVVLALGQTDDREAIRLGGLLPPLLARARSPRPPIQGLATLALIQLAQTAACAASIRREGGVQQLVDALRAEDEGRRIGACKLLEALVRHEGEAIGRAGGVHALVQQLDGRSAEVQLAATTALEAFRNTPSKEAALAAGAPTRLLRQLAGPDSRLRQATIRSLRVLVHRHPGWKDGLREAGIFPVLVELFDDPERFPTDAAALLGDLIVGSRKNQDAVRGAGGLPPLVRELTSGRDVVRLFFALAQDNPENRDAIRDAGALPPLVRLLRVGSAKSKACAQTLGELARTHPANQDAIRRAGAIPALVKQLEDSLAPVSETEQRMRRARRFFDSTDLFDFELGFLPSELDSTPLREPLDAAAWALCRLASRNPANQDAIREAGAIPLLVDALGTDDRDGRRSAVQALDWLVWKKPVNQAAVVQHSGFPKLVALLDDGPTADLPTLRSAAAVLTWLGDTPAHKEAVRRAGGIPRLVRLLDSSDPRTRENAASALRWLAKDSQPIQDAVAKASGIPRLVGLLDTEDATLRQNVAAAIAWLVKKHPANQAAVAKAGGIPKLVHLLSDDSAPTRRSATSALSWLVDAPAHKEAARKAGAIPKLVQLLDDAHAAQRHNAVSTLEWLAKDSQPIQDAIAQAGGIPRLVNLLDTEDATLRRHVASAIAVLVRKHPATQAAVAKAGGIPKLVHLLSDDTAPTRRNATSALTWLVDAPAHKEAARKAGAIPRLVHLLDDAHAGQRHNAASALRWLAKDSQPIQDAIAQAGGIPKLVKLLGSSDTAANPHAIMLLRGLSQAHRSFRKELAQLAKEPAVRTLLEKHDISFKVSFFW